MSRSLLSKLGPATHRVLAAALVHERALGKPMSPAMIQRLCEAEGASLGACLAFILGQGRDVSTGKLVRIGSPDSAIDARDEETEAALDWSEKHGDPAPR